MRTMRAATVRRSLLLTLGVLALAGSAAAGDDGTGAAGYDRGFFIRDADGRQELRVGLVSQTRYLHNHGRSDDRQRANVGGFQLRRLQVDLQGRFLDPRVSFRLRLDSSNGGTLSPAHAWVGFRPTSSVDLRVGQLKPPFLAEENVSGALALAAERSYVNDYFSVDFTQGVVLSWRPSPRLQLAGSVHSGSYAMRTDFDNHGTAVALAGRAECLLGGGEPARGWRLLSDWSCWPEEQAAAQLGVAVDWERGQAGGNGNLPDLLKWTLDASAQWAGTGLFAAAVGQAMAVRGLPAAPVPARLDGARQLGLVAQASHFVLPGRLEPLVRAEWLDFDGVYYRANLGTVHGDSEDLADDDRLTLLTVGANWYLQQHRAKLTVDSVFAFDAVPAANTGTGLLARARAGQRVVRGQLQLCF